jgi:two-component system response regulator YesN
MIRVVIAEDEELIREGLRDQLPWRSLGMEVVGLAANGKEAVRLCRELQPGILLTDIRMPLLDGLELIRQVREADERLVCLIISGYDDFHYAQRAIALGVSHYFLKPLELGEIEDQLRRIGERIRLERRKSRQRAVLSRFVSSVLPFVRRQYFLELIYGPYDNREVAERLAGIGALHDSSYCAVALVQLGVGQRRQGNRAIEKRYGQLLRGEHYSGDDIYLFKRAGAEALFVVVFIGDENEGLRTLIHRYVDRVLRLPAVSAAAPGTVHQNVNSLHESFLEARKELLLRQLLRQSGLRAEPSEHRQAEAADWSALEGAVRGGNTGQVSALLDTVTEALAAPTGSDEDRAGVLTGLFRSLSRLAEEAGINLETRLREAQRAAGYDRGDTSLGELFAGLKKTALELSALHSGRKDQTARHLIEKAKRFIERRYVAWDLSLEEVADFVELNPSYFSVVFKSVEGVNYIDYLTQLRMEKARELLREAQLKISAVAQKVGFQTPGYFGYLFKKHYGLTPSEFRARCGAA